MKKTVSFLTAVAMALSMGVTAFASGFAESLNTVASDHKSINIIYNGQLMKYTDVFPENINDRVMLPFRAVLEGMGATVDYEDASRLVTAERGDITITFKLLDDTIYIDKGGEKSELKMDVPMIIKNDRTLVPIRFISNALGMQVGWEGDFQTVLIVDTEAYADDFEKATPNMTKLSEKNQIRYNKSTTDMSVGFKTNDKEASFGMQLDSKTADNSASIIGKISADISDLGVKAAPVKDADIEIITADGKLYIKTNLAAKLFTTDDSSPLTDALKASIKEDKWYVVDVDALTDKLFGDNIPDGIKDIYTKLLSGDIAELENMLLPDIVASLGVSEGDATLVSAMQADMMIDAYKELDKYITVTDNKVEMKFTKKDFLDLFDKMGVTSVMSDEEMKQLSDAFTFDVYALTEYGKNTAESKANITIGFKNENLGDIKFTVDIKESSENDKKATPAQPPKNALDLMEIINALN